MFESNECLINYIFEMNVFFRIKYAFESNERSNQRILAINSISKTKVHTNDAGIKRFSGLRDFCREAKRREGEMSE